MAAYLPGGQQHQQGQQHRGKSGKTDRVQTRQINTYNKMRQTAWYLTLPPSPGKRRPLSSEVRAAVFKLEGLLI